MRIWTRCLGPTISGKAQSWPSVSLGGLHRQSSQELSSAASALRRSLFCGELLVLFKEGDPGLFAEKLESCQMYHNITTDRPKIKGVETERKSPMIQSFKLFEWDMVLPAIASEIPRVFLV